jgi:hypothetical protein
MQPDSTRREIWIAVAPEMRCCARDRTAQISAETFLVRYSDNYSANSQAHRLRILIDEGFGRVRRVGVGTFAGMRLGLAASRVWRRFASRFVFVALSIGDWQRRIQA